MDGVFGIIEEGNAGKQNQVSRRPPHTSAGMPSSDSCNMQFKYPGCNGPRSNWPKWKSKAHWAAANGSENEILLRQRFDWETGRLAAPACSSLRFRSEVAL